MLNNVTLMGRMTRDPELRYTPSGTAVASFTLAIDRDFANDGNRDTDFIDVVAWRQTAEFTDKYFQKGSMTIVAGRLQMREWQDKDGNRRKTIEVVAERVYFGEGKKDAGGTPRPAGRAVDVQNDESDFKGSAFSELDNGDGDLPF